MVFSSKISENLWQQSYQVRNTKSPWVTRDEPYLSPTRRVLSFTRDVVVEAVEWQQFNLISCGCAWPASKFGSKPPQTCDMSQKVSQMQGILSTLSPSIKIFHRNLYLIYTTVI